MIVCRVEQFDYELLQGLATEDIVELFKTDDKISALVLIDGDDVVGTLIGTIDDCVFKLLTLYVHPDYRGKGGGKLLLSAIKEILDEFAIPIHAAWEGEEEESENICNFLEKQGFLKEREKELRSYMVKVSQIQPPEKEKKKSERIISFEDLGDTFLKTMDSDKNMNEERMIPEGGFLSPDIRKDISMALVKNEKPVSYIIFKEKDGELELSTLYSTDTSKMQISLLLFEAVYAVCEKCDKDMYLHINAVTDGVDELVKYFIPTAKDISYSYYG